jgi:hypothetical protein
LTRAELVWFLLLGALMAWVILGTTRNEMMEVRERLALDTLEHLAGMISHTLEGAETEDLPLPSAGPGRLPEGLEAEVRSDLASLLPDDAYLPEDPWGRAYLLVRVFDTPDADHLMVICGGPDGIIRDLSHEDRKFAEFITFPRRR